MSEGFTDAPEPSELQSGRRSAVANTGATESGGNIKGPPDWVIQVTLAEPIILRAKDDGQILEQIDGLRFRKPTALDLIEIGGPPCTMDVYADNPPSTTTFDGKKMTAMMARLSAVNPPFLTKMSTGDWMYCAYQLSPFFYPVAARPHNHQSQARDHLQVGSLRYVRPLC